MYTLSSILFLDMLLWLSRDESFGKETMHLVEVVTRSFHPERMWCSAVDGFPRLLTRDLSFKSWIRKIIDKIIIIVL